MGGDGGGEVGREGGREGGEGGMGVSLKNKCVKKERKVGGQARRGESGSERGRERESLNFLLLTHIITA